MAANLGSRGLARISENKGACQDIREQRGLPGYPRTKGLAGISENNGVSRDIREQRGFQGYPRTKGFPGTPP